MCSVFAVVTARLRSEGARKGRIIGVEGSLNYGAALTKLLLSQGEDVREVPALTHRERRKRRSQGKSDLVDAVAIARVVAREDDLPSARRTPQLSDLKLWWTTVTSSFGHGPRWPTAPTRTFPRSGPGTNERSRSSVPRTSLPRPERCSGPIAR